MSDTTEQVHCHHCQRLIGETSQSLVFVGMFRAMRDRHLVAGPRDTYHCKSCGWCNVFQPQAVAMRDYRSIELKAS